MATKKKESAPTPRVPAETAPTPSAPGQQEGYCVKCKTKRVMTDTQEVTTNGRRMLKGTCPTCGTHMNRILGKA